MIRNRRNLVAVLFSCLFVAGCQTYSLVQAERVSIDEGYSVDPGREWNKRTTGEAQIWTVDGETLQALHLYEGLEDGDALFKLLDGDKQELLPKYSKNMSLLDVREFIEASFVQFGFANMKTLKFEPAKFAGNDGFRADFTFTSKNGLRNQGFAAGAKLGDKLYLIIYRGAKLHYYDKYLREVEDVVRSVQLAWAANLI